MLVQQHGERAIRVKRLLALTDRLFFGSCAKRFVCRTDVREMPRSGDLLVKVKGRGIKVPARSAESRDVTFTGFRTGFKW